LQELQKKFSGEFPTELLRTLQRKIKIWKAQLGQDKDVIFLQKHHSAEQGISDFTDMNTLGVTIDQELLKHSLYHFRLTYSGWTFPMVVLGG
jgi:hypothetical protein